MSLIEHLFDSPEYTDADLAFDSDNFKGVDERREQAPGYKLYVRPDSAYWRKMPGTNDFYPPIP